jgi:hypothetical protein
MLDMYPVPSLDSRRNFSIALTKFCRRRGRGHKEKAPVSEDDFKTLNLYQAISKYITHEVYQTNLLQK